MRGIESGCALRRFSAGPRGRSLPRFSSACPPCLTAHPCGAFRRSHVVLPAYPRCAFGAFLPFGPGKVARGWRSAAGVPEIPRARVVLGNPGYCGLAVMGAPAARQGSGQGPRRRSVLRPAAGDGFEIFRGTQLWFALWRFSVGPFGRFLPRFPALPCCSSRHIQVAPSGVSMPCPKPSMPRLAALL